LYAAEAHDARRYDRRAGCRPFLYELLETWKLDLIDGEADLIAVANNFWGKDDAGVGPLLERMHAAKLTCDELRSFYGGNSSWCLLSREPPR
jgi:hypothetical protein